MHLFTIPYRHLLWIIVVFSVIGFGAVFARPYSIAQQTRQHLMPDRPTPALDAQIRHYLRPQSLNNNIPKWEGVGHHYLRDNWQTTMQDRDASALFRLYLAQYPENAVHREYLDFPNRFALRYGHHADAILLIWWRKSWWEWQLHQVCSVKPHPSELLSTCPSESR